MMWITILSTILLTMPQAFGAAAVVDTIRNWYAYSTILKAANNSSVTGQQFREIIAENRARASRYPEFRNLKGNLSIGGNGDPHKMQILFEAGLGPSVGQERDRFLAIACHLFTEDPQKQIKYMTIYLGRGASANTQSFCRTYHGTSSVLYDVFKGPADRNHVDAARLLIGFGADINKRFDLPARYGGPYPERPDCFVHSMIRWGKAEWLKFLLQEGANPLPHYGSGVEDYAEEILQRNPDSPKTKDCLAVIKQCKKDAFLNVFKPKQVRQVLPMELVKLIAEYAEFPL